MAIKTLTVAQEGLTLDALLFREFKRELALQVEDVLNSNPYLAGKGLFLPLGTKVEVEIPDVPANATPVVRVLRLWG